MTEQLSSLQDLRLDVFLEPLQRDSTQNELSSNNIVASPLSNGKSRRSSLQNRIQQCMPRLAELRKASISSSFVKVDPAIRRVPTDCSQVSDFQKTLLATFEDDANDENETIRQIFVALNSMLQSIIMEIVVEGQGLTNSRIAREVSISVVALLVRGIQEIAQAINQPSLKMLLLELGRRFTHVHEIVRSHFILETLELEQIVSSLQDTLGQERAANMRLRDELTILNEKHRRKLAEAQFTDVVDQAKHAKDETKQSDVFSLDDPELSSLNMELNQLKASHDHVCAQLQSAVREVAVLHTEVEMLSEPTFRDRHVLALQDELDCEGKRVKALENEIQDLRIKQTELSMGKLRGNKPSIVHKLRCSVAHPTAESTDSDSQSSDVEPTTPTSSRTDDWSRLFKSIFNYEVNLSPIKTSFGGAATAVAATVKLRAMKSVKLLQPDAIPGELAPLRQLISALYDRKWYYDEYAALAHARQVPLLELAYGWFIARHSTLSSAEAEAKSFMDQLSRFRDVCGLVRLMEEFLHGQHEDDVVQFYLWVTKSLSAIDVGIAFPTAPDIHPQHICKSKALLVVRTIFRTLKFQTSGLARGTHVNGVVDPKADKVTECHRLFASAAEHGPMYMGEFNAILDLFCHADPAGECYPLDVFLYLLVLMYKKQKEWQMEHALRIFHRVSYDAFREEQRRKAEAEALLAATIASNKKAAVKTKTKKKRKKKREVAPKDMTKETFQVFLAKLDLTLQYTDLHELMAQVVCHRQEYAKRITPQAFAHTAEKFGWFRHDFMRMPSLVDSIQSSMEESIQARKLLASTWERHGARLIVFAEHDRNPLLSHHVLHLRHRLVDALDKQQHVLVALTYYRSILACVWQLVARRCSSRHTQEDKASRPASFADLMRSSELSFITKGICAIPEPRPGPQVFEDVVRIEAEEAVNCSHLDINAIRDLIPQLETSKSSQLDQVILRHAAYLHEIYCAYSLIDSSTFGLSFDAFQVLLHDMAVVSTDFTVMHANAVFNTVQKRRQIERLHDAAFLELLVRVAVARDALEIDSATRESLHIDRLALLFEHFISQFLVPNVCQAAPNLSFRQQVAAVDVQRLLYKHRNFLRRVFIHYARQDTLDEDLSRMNYVEFETFLSEFQLNDDACFPQSMNLLVFNAVQEDGDDRQCVYHEFTSAIVAIAQIRDNNPFVKIKQKTTKFIQHLIAFAQANHHALHLRAIFTS
ncbi:hypothetical protein Ae201684P_006400 [Aphanomyces euteiches]|uniref:EF-hand domain-containing protein n=1 Tax=Aphanomyces euteiches TaxID=100861 RepID=A0A6G0XBU5_9STRA|nr:hypothetical protein Ae201684_006315 [Aphanomyces euteiches]KAH9090999.1 hypothetical protein Ae201684P_006400 [Aphanomyces euteiches]KAH9143049.1 hypothetical protein AeRB84_012916 [Aphanomyces euteiches]